VNPYDHPDLFSVITVGDRTSPGVVTLSNHDRGHNWDVKTVKGTDGSSSSYVGSPVGQFKASFTLVKDVETGEDQFELWDDFQRYLETLLTGEKPAAVSIYHPDLARQHYTEVTLAGISGVTHDQNGVGFVTVDFIEYKPPKPKPIKSTTAKTGSSKKQADDPNIVRKREVAALTAEASRP
jgi:hypothetical protein